MRWKFWQEAGDPDRMDWQPTGPLHEQLQGQAQAAPRSTWTTVEVAQLALLTGGIYGARRGYKRYLRRIPNIEYLKPGILRHRSLYGYVTRVGDGDNFRLFHTPGGMLAGWGWFPGRKPQEMRKAQLRLDNTLHVRVAGVDAPECAHFGRQGQPHGKDALAFLTDAVEGRYVRVWPYSRDRFDRIVSSVGVRLPWRPWRSDLGLKMIQSGWATVYEAKTGSEFGGMEDKYREAERIAREKKVGMWKEVGLLGKMLGQTGEVETPRAYKNRHNKEESGK